MQLHYLSGPDVGAERGGDEVYEDDGVLRLRHVDAAHLERARDVRLPVRAVEQRHGAEALEWQDQNSKKEQP